MIWTSNTNPNASHSYSSQAMPFMLAMTTNAARLDNVNVVNLIRFLLNPSDESQSYYFTPVWQEREREAEQDLHLGRFQVFDSMDDFINSLDDPLEDE
ncbi:MAG: hypothetical protein HY741_08980 [Chloroflexi bacterium]|nr:hypothetical protein [Chloroflexota bacterium]